MSVIHWREFRELRYRYQILIPVVLLGLAYGLITLDRSATLNYSQNACVARWVPFPGLFSGKSGAYEAYFADIWQVGGVKLTASSLCAKPLQVPEPGKTEASRLSLFGVPGLFQSGIKVTPEALPEVKSPDLKDGLAVSRPLRISTSVPDATFDYKLHVDGKTVNCQMAGTSQVCAIEKLQLRQATPYTIELFRYFNDERVGSVFKRKVTTLAPVSILASSISPGQTVLARPTSVDFATDKPVQSADAVLQKKDGTVIQAEVGVADKAIKVTFAELSRSTEYTLTLKNVVAIDGSTLLDKAYVLPFAMSGGPRVTGVNIGRSGVSVGTTVVVSFDQNLSPSQDVTPLVKVAGGVALVAKQGNQLRFSTSGVPRCGDFSVAVGKGIQSEHGVTGDSAWSYGSRTLCQQIGSIGSSVQGRSITSYRFGSGPNTILFVGLTHGNERGTYSLLSEWVDELEAKARQIPADKSVIVIPALNRDGLASGNRRNARNVDLNRNFPTNDWKADVTMPGGEMVAGGGGSSPLSEPESSALASFTVAQSPRLVLTYHSIGSLVTPNEAGVSGSYAGIYSQYSGYYVSPKSAAGSTFEYDTTGAYEDWLYEKPGISALLVELGSHTSSSSGRNMPAMWAMLR